MLRKPGPRCPARGVGILDGSNARVAGPATIAWLEARWLSGRGCAEAWLRHEGGSMVPALRGGDRLLVTPLIGAPPPRPGEIVIARRGDRLVAHRLIALDGDFVITRGDACSRPDPPLRQGRLLGRVVRVERTWSPAGRVRSWWSNLTRIRRQR